LQRPTSGHSVQEQHLPRLKGSRTTRYPEATLPDTEIAYALPIFTQDGNGDAAANGTHHSSGRANDPAAAQRGPFTASTTGRLSATPRGAQQTAHSTTTSHVDGRTRTLDQATTAQSAQIAQTDTSPQRTEGANNAPLVPRQRHPHDSPRTGRPPFPVGNNPATATADVSLDDDDDDHDDANDDMAPLPHIWLATAVPTPAGFRCGEGTTPTLAAMKGQWLTTIALDDSHTPALAKAGVVKTTRQGHKRILRALAETPQHLQNAPLVTAVLEHINDSRRTKGPGTGAAEAHLCRPNGPHSAQHPTNTKLPTRNLARNQCHSWKMCTQFCRRTMHPRCLPNSISSKCIRCLR
jgi:hypothetical protein